MIPGIRVTTRPDVFGYRGELDSRLGKKLASELEVRLKTRADPGVDIRKDSVTKRVTAEGNRLVISSEKSKAEPGDVGLKGKTSRRHRIGDLFQVGSGIPDIRVDNSGVSKLVFRSVKMDTVMAMDAKAEETFIDQQTQQILSLDLERYLEEAIRDVLDSKPELRFAEEGL